MLFVKPLRHLSMYQGDVFKSLKIVFIKNRNIRKNKTKFERPFDGDNGHFTCQECRKIRITENLPKGTWNFVWTIEIFELQRFQLRKGKKSLLRKFHGDFTFVQIKEIFELERVNFTQLRYRLSVDVNVNIVLSSIGHSTVDQPSGYCVELQLQWI